MDRVVYLTLPPEFEEKGIAWKLKTRIYGLSDAPRDWYLRVKEEFDILRVKYSRFETALSFWYTENELYGLLIMHVDDFYWKWYCRFSKNYYCTPMDCQTGWRYLCDLTIRLVIYNMT